MATVGCHSRNRFAVGGLVFLCSGSLTCGADVLGPGLGEDLFRPFDFCGVFGVDRDEEVARLDLALIAFGFDLGDAQADQPAGDATRSRTDGGTAQRGDNRTRGDERTDSGNGSRGAGFRSFGQRPELEGSYPRSGLRDSFPFPLLAVRPFAGLRQSRRLRLESKRHGPTDVGLGPSADEMAQPFVSGSGSDARIGDLHEAGG